MSVINKRVIKTGLLYTKKVLGSIYGSFRLYFNKNKINALIAQYSKSTELSGADGFSLIMVNENPVYSQNRINDRILKKGPIAPESLPADRSPYICPPMSGKDYLAEVKDALLIGQIPFGVTKTGKLLEDTIDYNRVDRRVEAALEKNIKVNSIHLFDYDRQKKLVKEAEQVDSACLLFSSWNHYGHWLPEHALKLRKLEEYEKIYGKKVKVVVERELPVWKAKLLELIGWTEDDIIRWNGPILKVKQLILPSYPEPGYEDLLWLKNKVLGERGGEKEKKRRLYISRRNFKKRCVINEDDIFPLLEDYGFEVIFPENLSVIDQAELFSEASVVVGPHGSGFTNILYSREAKVIEMFAYRVPLYFYRLSLVMGHHYWPFYCEIKKDLEGDDPLWVDVQELKKCLDQVSI